MQWCRFEKGDDAWRTLLTSRAVPFLLLTAAHLDLHLPATLVSEFNSASLLLSDSPSRLLTELASAMRGRPRDDDVTTSLTPFLAAFCASPLQPEQRAQVEQLTTEVERAQNSERATLETTSFPADEVRHLAALRAHLEAAAAAVASEQAMYDALVTLCATLGPPARLYARASDTLHTPALRLLHERVVGGSNSTPLDPNRSATYWAALAFAGAAESALQTLYAKEVRGLSVW